MTIIAKDKKGNKYKFITQQYDIGLYVAVYENNRILDQLSFDMTENEFNNNFNKMFKGLKKVKK